MVFIITNLGEWMAKVWENGWTNEKPHGRDLLEFHSSREATQKSQKTNIFRHFSRRMEFQVGRAKFIGCFIFGERGGTT
jgi:hypothetical protein